MSDKNNGLWATNTRGIKPYYLQIDGGGRYRDDSMDIVGTNAAGKGRTERFDKVHKSKATYLLPEEVLT